jgi:hypothetical protein
MTTNADERKAARTSRVIATKALACKLAKAAWYLMVEGTACEPARMFGLPAATSMKTGLWECGGQLLEGVGFEPWELIGGGRAPPLYNPVELLEEKILQAIRPCRESKTGWTRRPGDGRGGTKSPALI